MDSQKLTDFQVSVAKTAASGHVKKGEALGDALQGVMAASQCFANLDKFNDGEKAAIYSAVLTLIRAANSIVDRNESALAAGEA